LIFSQNFQNLWLKTLKKFIGKKRRQFNYEIEIGGAFQFCRGQGGGKKTYTSPALSSNFCEQK
jgi:hypothetical protein